MTHSIIESQSTLHSVENAGVLSYSKCMALCALQLSSTDLFKIRGTRQWRARCSQRASLSYTHRHCHRHLVKALEHLFAIIWEKKMGLLVSNGIFSEI
jgi:hypothetical protein